MSGSGPLLSDDAERIIRVTRDAFLRAADVHVDLVKRSGGDETAIYVSLGEALFWATTLDDLLKTNDWPSTVSTWRAG